MKKFSFSLEKLLRYREQLFQAEQIVLRDMRAALAQMEAALEAMRLDRKRRTQEYREKLEQIMIASEMELHQAYMRILDENIIQKHRQIQLQQMAIDKQIDKVREAKVEISTIEKLKEKKLDEYNYLAGKENELFIEEFISTQKAMSAQM